MGATYPQTCAIGTSLLVAVGWETWQKANGGKNSAHEMVLDIVFSLAGSGLMTFFLWSALHG